MAIKPRSTALQPSSGNLMLLFFLNKCLLSYIIKLLVLEMEATYEGWTNVIKLKMTFKFGNT